MQCKKCKSTTFITARKEMHYGLYCNNCLTWVKWIPIDQIDFSHPIHELKTLIESRTLQCHLKKQRKKSYYQEP